MIRKLSFAQTLYSQIFFTIDIGKTVHCGTREKIIDRSINSVERAVGFFDMNAESIGIKSFTNSQRGNFSAYPDNSARQTKTAEMAEIRVHGKLLRQRGMIFGRFLVEFFRNKQNAVIEIVFGDRRVNVVQFVEFRKMISLVMEFFPGNSARSFADRYNRSRRGQVPP